MQSANINTAKIPLKFTEAKWTTVVKFVQHISVTSYTVFLIDIYFICLYSGGKGYPPKLTLSEETEVS